VEDEAVVRSLAEKILCRLGYEVLSAGSGSEALDIVKAHPDRIHLLITDVIMPGMNGKELYDQLSGILPELRVLYFSGYDGDIISRHGILDPDIRFLRKPFSIESLSRTVRAALDG
jgi:CheY-like chemotaxis protein